MIAIKIVRTKLLLYGCQCVTDDAINVPVNDILTEVSLPSYPSTPSTSFSSSTSRTDFSGKCIFTINNTCINQYHIVPNIRRGFSQKICFRKPRSSYYQ